MKVKFPRFIAILITVFVLLSLDCANSDAPRNYTYKVIKTFPHDPEAFTEGLVFEDGFLYEGTGQRGRSTLRKVELETGKILKIQKLPYEFFGEGIAIYNDKIIQLTYRSRVGFVYEKESFKVLQKFDYPTEGWGITYDGNQLIMSDGTDILYFLSPETFEVLNRIEVRDKDTAVSRLNELEYIKGEIYANVWMTERIVRIDPKTGKVVGWIHMDGIKSLLGENVKVDVLNGIAYDAAGDRLFVTGKCWPKIFQIELVESK